MKEFILGNTSNIFVLVAVLIAILGGFAIGHLTNTETKEKRKKKVAEKNFLNLQKTELENMLEELIVDLNKGFRSFSKGVNIFTGNYFRYRVYLMYTVKYKKDAAIIRFFFGNGEQACEDGPEIYFNVNLQEEIDDELEEAITSKVHRCLSVYE